MSPDIQRAVYCCLDKFIAKAVQLVFVVMQVVTPGLDYGRHPIAGVLHRPGDRYNRSDPVASSRQHYCAVLLDLKRSTQRPNDMCEIVTCLQQHEFSAGLTLLQYNQRDCAVLSVPVAQRIGHALGLLIDHHDNELAGLRLFRHLRRLDDDLVNIRRDLAVFQDSKRSFVFFSRNVGDTAVVNGQLSQAGDFFVDAMPPEVGAP